MTKFKNLLFSLTIFFIFSFSNANAGYGKGDLTLTENGVKGFHKYIQGAQGIPLRAVVTNDGNHFFWRYCPAAQCAPEGDAEAVKYCERETNLICATFAVCREVKWRNGINPGGKEARFKKSMTLDEVRDKLAALGFLDNDYKKKVSDTNKTDISKRLETLTSLYEKGLLTEDEFKKAKEKLLK